ncbi:MAG: hypothetical protein ACKO6N_27465 [Myxococcota bacterium]
MTGTITKKQNTGQGMESLAGACREGSALFAKKSGAKKSGAKKSGAKNKTRVKGWNPLQERLRGQRPLSLKSRFPSGFIFC